MYVTRCIAFPCSSTLLQPGSDQSHGQSAHNLQGGRSASNTAPTNTSSKQLTMDTTPDNIHATLGDTTLTSAPMSIVSNVMTGKTATLDSWGQPRLVEIQRHDGENLGISIVGEHSTVVIGTNVNTFPYGKVTK